MYRLGTQKSKKLSIANPVTIIVGVRRTSTVLRISLRFAEASGQAKTKQNQLTLQLDHAFDKFVYCFASVACFAACAEALLCFALEAFRGRVQLEKRLNILKVPMRNLARCKGSRQICKRLVTDFLGIFVGKFLVAQEPPTLRQQCRNGFFRHLSPCDVALCASEHADHRRAVLNEHSVVGVSQVEHIEGFSGFALRAD
jgi:hypothetical protein